MNNDELKQYLESRRKNTSEKEFFELIFGMLENTNLSNQTRSMLDAYLLTYSFIDKDRVARYWEKYLSDTNPVRREFAMIKLSILSTEPDSIAFKILTQFLGEEPTKDRIEEIIEKRLLGLFPHKKEDD